MKDLGIIHRILGCEVLYDEYAGTFSINQSNTLNLYATNTYLLEVQPLKLLCLIQPWVRKWARRVMTREI